MQNQPLQEQSPSLTVFRLAVVFFVIGLVADFAGYTGIAGAAVLVGLCIAAIFLGVLAVLMILIRRDRWWDDSVSLRPCSLAAPGRCAPKHFLVPKLKVTQ